MKKNIVFLMTILLQFPVITYGAIFQPLVTITPNPPLTKTDPISAILSGNFSTPGFGVNTSILITANNIQIDFNSSSPINFVPQLITPFSSNVNIGMLNAGNYTLTTNFLEDGILQHTLTSSLTVASIRQIPTVSQWSIVLLSIVISGIVWSQRLRYSTK